MSDSRIDQVLSVQSWRLVRALRTADVINPDPIVREDERLRSEEYVTLCYEVYHIILRVLEDDGIVEFDRDHNEVTRGERFDDIRPALEHDETAPGETPGSGWSLYVSARDSKTQQR